MKITKTILTPELATKLIEINTHNRAISEKHVEVLENDISNGRWKENGDTIVVSGTKLIDGQHRCWAVIGSGISIPIILVEEVDEDVFDTKDVGKRRSAGDIFSISKIPDAIVTAAVVAYIERIQLGLVEDAFHPSNSEILELYHKYPGVDVSISKCRSTKRMMSATALAALHYLFAKIDQTEADQFVEDLLTGNNIAEGDPVKLLRSRLAHNFTSRAKVSKAFITALIIKTWNKRREGKVMRQLAYRRAPTESSKSSEAFPIIK